MNARRPPVDSERSLRLVSDEGRTVADPQPPERQSMRHPSMPPSVESAPTRTLEDNELYAAVEAVLMVATEPVAPEVLASVIALGPATAEAMCDDLAREYAASERGFALVRVAGGYQLQSAPAAAEFVERFVGGRRSARLSAAAMETLAVVAYKQPVSRAQISAIRGVNADGVVRTLADQGYIAEVARDPGPGNAALLGTTPTFLERLSLDSLDDLPSLAELQVDADAVEAMDRLAAGKDS